MMDLLPNRKPWSDWRPPRIVWHKMGASKKLVLDKDINLADLYLTPENMRTKPRQSHVAMPSPVQAKSHESCGDPY